ncbi:hypothetical protein IC582_020384 [Cucumis melo]
MCIVVLIQKKNLWTSLEKKYKTEVVGANKFIVEKFMDYKMVDSKTVISQVHEKNMTLSEPFQVALIIEKLSPSWKDFKNYLKHKRKEIKLEELVVRLGIEENNRKAEKCTINNTIDPKANIVENRPQSNKKKKFSGEVSNKKPRFTKKFNGKCFNCNKMGHQSKDCRKSKNFKKKHAQAHIAEVDEVSDGVADIDLCAVISECNMVGNSKKWWVDTGATHHICANKNMFTVYVSVSNGEQLFMGNSSTSKVEGQGKVILKMSSGKELILNNVLHVPDIRKNLVSGYLSDGLFKLNILVPKSIINNKVSTFAYIVKSFVCHDRLGHVNFNSLRRLINMNLIPKFTFDTNHSCEVCVESKMTKTPFHSTEKMTKSLELIHNDICDLKFVQTKSGKNYFITFIDDCTRYCYVYLLKSKYEVVKVFKFYKKWVKNQLSTKIKAIKSDRGGEYGFPFEQFCSEHDVIHQTTAPYSPQSNGIAERKKRTLTEMMNAILISSGLSQNLWGEALLTQITY